MADFTADCLLAVRDCRLLEIGEGGLRGVCQLCQLRASFGFSLLADATCLFKATLLLSSLNWKSMDYLWCALEFLIKDVPECYTIQISSLWDFS